MLSRIELDREALRHNLAIVRGLVGEQCLISPSIKANAYGHGLVETARALADVSDGFSVFSLAEAVALQEASLSQPILVMGPLEEADYAEAIRRDLRIFVDSLTSARGLAAEAVRQGKTVRAHLKVDTGMARFGVRYDQLEDFLTELGKPDGLEFEGVATQTANADEAGDNPTIHEQKERFLAVVEVVKQHGYAPAIRHMANSGVTLRYPEMYLDMVRPGMACYGYAPVPAEENLLAEQALKLRPVLRLLSTVATVKTVPAGTPVSYGGHFVTERETKLAVFPLGYSDGVSAVLTNIGEVLIRGQRAPIRGRVCMNATIVDITEIPDAQVGDEVVLLGRQGEEEITAEEWAQKVNRDTYAVLTGLAPHLSRVVV